MRIHVVTLFAVSLLTATPAMAGNLTFDNGQTAWRSTQCNKPNPPSSILAAHPETAGNDMNDLVSQHNAYVDAAQNYMNCISSEAEHDQGMVTQSIASSAQHLIAQTQDEVNAATQALRNNRNN